MTFRTVEQFEAIVAEQAQEVGRLRALVKEAYEEGWDSARYGSGTDDDDWLTSNTRAALQPKEETK